MTLPPGGPAELAGPAERAEREAVAATAGLAPAFLLLRASAVTMERRQMAATRATVEMAKVARSTVPGRSPRSAPPSPATVPAVVWVALAPRVPPTARCVPQTVTARAEESGGTAALLLAVRRFPPN